MIHFSQSNLIFRPRVRYQSNQGVSEEKISQNILKNSLDTQSLLYSILDSKSDIRSLSQRIDRLDTKIDHKFNELSHKIDQQGKELNAKIDKLDTKFDAKIDKLDAKIDAKIDKLDAKIDQQGKELNAKIDKLDTKFDAKIDKLDAKIDQQDKELNTKIDKLGTKIDKLTEAFLSFRESSMEKMIETGRFKQNYRLAAVGVGATLLTIGISNFSLIREWFDNKMSSSKKE